MLVSIASKCEFNYAGMGRSGYLYESMKDQLRWHSISVKEYISLISTIGQIMSLSDEDFSKAKAKAMKMSNSSLADALITAFGDGK